MKITSTRDLVAQAVIALAVCVGGWMTLVKPRMQELAQLEAVVTENAALTASSINQQTVQNAATQISNVKSRLGQIRSFNEIANDSSRLYGIVMDLADAHRVQVQTLQPGSARQSNDDKTVSATRLNMTVEGEYQSIASFLEAVCSVDAFVRPISVSVTTSRSANTGNSVEAVFQCDFMNFAVADSLEKLGG